MTKACNLAITIGGCSVKLAEQYLQPSMQEDINEYEFYGGPPCLDKILAI